MVDQRVLGTVVYGVVSANIVGGFGGKFNGHTLGHMGGDTVGVWRPAVVAAVAGQRLGCTAVM